MLDDVSDVATNRASRSPEHEPPSDPEPRPNVCQLLSKEPFPVATKSNPSPIRSAQPPTYIARSYRQQQQQQRQQPTNALLGALVILNRRLADCRRASRIEFEFEYAIVSVG
ncbi:hypothetical protein M5D96_006090 [Drosophila gunungcola]|uniref:Uncharacterized protein n=1 Tax=Drosophila gunungcola TaxID=103775 RepID=A0A9P9YRN2_9MUSC|nr:hypothetical protein M5D96_006090 [Drosophila gunungcola]